MVKPLTDNFRGGPVMTEYVIELLVVDCFIDEVLQRRKLVKVVVTYRNVAY
jgi:hypothetical protein